MPLSLLALAAGAFGIGTTEFIIMGLLTQVSQDLHISIPTAGSLISGYAIGVAVGAPVLTLLTRQWPRKRLLLALMLIFIAGNLAAAITLAREELGIVITLHQPELLIPGSATADRGAGGTPLQGLAVQLADRLSARGVITGDIHYPAVDGEPDSERYGTLIVLQAVLTADMPYELHSYAVANRAFPNDGTSDQWFDHQQFDAYQTLGRYLGEQAGPVIEQALAAAPAGSARAGSAADGYAAPVPAQPPGGSAPTPSDRSADSPPVPRRPAEG